MSMRASLLHTVVKQLTIGFLISGLIVSAGIGVPRQAQAQAPVIVTGGIGTIQDTISAAANSLISGFQNSLFVKEYSLDGIAHALAKKILAQTTQSIVDWINTGFEGKPAFITNMKQYLLNAADEVAGDFLAQSNFAFLCQPLQRPVRFIIYNEYVNSRDWQKASQCTVTGALGNIETFFDENFSPQGWQQWFEMVSVPQNNVYGASAIGLSRLLTTSESAKQDANTEAIVNDGMLSVKDCSTGTCVVVTPGKVISEYLNFSLTVGDRILIEADEINEIIGALFNQLATQAITGAGGLLGLSYSSDGNSPSYLDSLGDEIDQMGTNAGSSNFLENALRTEQQYRAIYDDAITDLEAVESDIASCSASSAGSLRSALNTRINAYEDEATLAGQIVSVLTFLRDEYNKATDPELKQVIADEFLKLEREGFLHSTTDIELARQEVAEEVVDLEDRADRLNCN